MAAALPGGEPRLRHRGARLHRRAAPLCLPCRETGGIFPQKIPADHRAPHRTALMTTNVAVLLITHARLGHDILSTVTEVMGSPPLTTDVMEVKRILDTDALVRQGSKLIER